MRATPENIQTYCQTRLTSVYWYYGILLALIAGYFLSLGKLSLQNSFSPLLYGFITWNIVEYSLHRWAFHISWPKVFWNHLTFGLHAYHHQKAKELLYIPLPVRFSFAILLLLVALFFAYYQNADQTLAAATAIILNYLYFEWIHNRIHTKKPANRLEKFIHAFHLYHHYGDSKRNFGLTYPFIDLVLGTAQVSSPISKEV